MHLIDRYANRVVLAVQRRVDRWGEIRPGTRAAEGFGSFGEDSSIGFPAATLMNTHAVHVGSGTLIGRGVTLAVGYGEGDPGVPERGIVIGDRCAIGARTTITGHASIEIGDGVFFGQGVFVTDASHGYQDPTRPVGEQFGAHQPVVIGAGSWIGHDAVVLPGTRIGRNVVVAAGAVVRGIIEDHAVVASSAARVVRRHEPGLGWVTDSGDVRPEVFGTFGEDSAEVAGR